MIIKDNDKIFVELMVDQFECDPVQYKPYSPKFSPVDALIVRVEIDPDNVIDEDENGEVLVITLKGLTCLMSDVADAVEKMHATRQSRNTRQYRG